MTVEVATREGGGARTLGRRVTARAVAECAHGRVRRVADCDSIQRRTSTETVSLTQPGGAAGAEVAPLTGDRAARGELASSFSASSSDRSACLCLCTWLSTI